MTRFLAILLLTTCQGLAVTIFVNCVGDSIAEGKTNNLSYIDGGPTTSGDGTNWNIIYRLINRSGNTISGTNCGVGGATLANCLALNSIGASLRIKPNYLWLHCGINDIVQGRSWDDYKANLDTVLLMSISSNSTLLVSEVLPYGKGTDAQNVTVRTWNTNLATYCTASNIYLWRIHDLLGTNRPSTGYKDDLAPEYDQGDHVHLTKQAYFVLGDALYDYITGATNIGTIGTLIIQNAHF